MSTGNKVLVIYLEPTPYLLALLERLEQRWPEGIDVDFTGMNLYTQPCTRQKESMATQWLTLDGAAK